MSALLTVGIVNYRTAALAARCYETVVAGSDIPTRLALVDTSDGPGAIDSLTAPDDLWCQYPGNIGYGPALNLAFADARTPYLLALNADTELPPSGIVPLIRMMEADPTIGVIGPRQINPSGYLVHGGIEVAGDPRGGRCFGELDQGQCMEPQLDVEQVSGSVMLMRASVWQRLGGMPAGVKLYYEEALYCARVRALGFRVVYSGLCTFVHHVAASPDPPEGRSVLAARSRFIFEAMQEVAP